MFLLLNDNSMNVMFRNYVHFVLWFGDVPLHPLQSISSHPDHHAADNEDPGFRLRDLNLYLPGFGNIFVSSQSGIESCGLVSSLNFAWESSQHLPTLDAL